MNPVNPILSKSGIEREIEIYELGLAGRKISIPVPLDALEAKAKEMLEPRAYDYVAGGAGGELTMRANREAFYQWRIVPRMMRDVSARDMSVEVLGTKLPAPVILGPVGVQGILHADAELATARAAASLALPFVLSTVCSRTMEQVAEAAGAGERWFQLYWGKNPELTASMLARAERAGYSALVVTLDTAMLGWRERDLERGYLPFLFAEGVANYFTDPVFRSLLKQPPEENPADAVRLWARLFSNTKLTSDDLGWLLKNTKMPIILKGILHAEDAKRALDAGMDGVIVSNHGGRQVDGEIAALDALPAVVKAVGEQLPVLFDSGIRRGADIMKALALGARAVLIGRLYVWGLAVAGEAGVRDAVQNLLADFDLSMALSGFTSPKELTPEILARAEGTAQHRAFGTV
ncbi:MAG TPA: alpha-hydroxy-acid oxidizing protein [Candidatus Acidoferrales bacterium]|nr:alpha-hydroxy-acid oxidizing protein [Candidatus Acidoferrales bacterium]